MPLQTVLNQFQDIVCQCARLRLPFGADTNMEMADMQAILSSGPQYAPHDFNGDGPQIGSFKGLAQAAHLIQDAAKGPYICLWAIPLALHEQGWVLKHHSN